MQAARLLPFAFLVLVGLGSMPGASAQACTDSTDDFDTDTVGQEPEACWYAFSASGTTVYVSPVRPSPDSSPNSLQVIDRGVVGFDLGSESTCTSAPESRTVKARFNIDVLHTLATDLFMVGFFTTPTAANSVMFVLEGDLDATLRVVNSAGTITSSTFNPGIVAAADTWYEVAVTYTCRSGATNDDFNAVWSEVGNPASTSVSAQSDVVGDFLGGNTNAFQVDMTGTGTNDYFVDDVEATGLPMESLAATATVAVTDLVGFDVDANGQTVLARTDAGDFVRSYTGATLAAQGTAVETDCGQADGVSSYGTHLTFYDCDGSGDVASIEIRSASFGTPSKPPVCSGAGFCIQSLPDEELAGGQDDDIGLASIQEFPIDYSEFTDNALSEDEVFMAFAFTSLQGNVGVVTYVMVNNFDDGSDIVFESVGGGQAPDTLCTALGSDGNTYLYASSTESNVVGFRVDFEVDRNAISTTHLVPSMTQVFSGTTSTAGPRGVACAEDRFAILNADKLTVWQRGVQAPILQVPATAGTTRGIALSDDAEWVAWADGTTVKVAAVDSDQGLGAENKGAGEVVTSFTQAAGTMRGIQLHGAGSSMWVATSSSISVYGDLYTLTTGEDVSYCAPPCITDPGDDDGQGGVDFGDSIFAGLISGGTVLTGNEVGGRLFATVILVLGFASVGASALSRPVQERAFGGVVAEDGWVFGLAIGAALGFLLAIGTDVFPEEWAFVGVLLGLLGAAAWMYWGRK